MNIPLLVLAGTLVLIAARRVGRLRVAIWQAMGAGAVVLLVSGQITPAAAWAAIDLDVMLFLFGMFVLGEALVESGYLYAVAYRVLAPVRSADGLLLAILFGCGLASALLMNDTLAVVGTPLMLRLAREHRLPPVPLLLTLAFAVTIGSVMSPIGNPQNLLIALHGGIGAPFPSFLGALALPTLVNLGLAYLLLRRVFRPALAGYVAHREAVAISDVRLALLCRLGLALVAAAIALRLLLAASPWAGALRLSHIALLGAAPVLLFSRRRWQVLRRIDWHTLVFFAALFIVVAAVWGSGVVQGGLARLAGRVAEPPVVMLAAAAFSQLISNVPLVALYLPLLDHAGAGEAARLALAAASTVAGNFLLVGAASNVIIAQWAERDGAVLGFWGFARVGIPLGLLNLAVYGVYLAWYYR